MTAFGNFADSIAELGRTQIAATVRDRQATVLFSDWSRELEDLLIEDPVALADPSIRAELQSAISGLAQAQGSPAARLLLGEMISALLDAERNVQDGRLVMERLLPEAAVRYAGAHRPAILVINPGSTSTKVAWFVGLYKIRESEVHLAPGDPDGADARNDGILRWMQENQLLLNDLGGIACRGGFIAPVPSGTYRVVSEMLADLENPMIEHASNLSISMAVRLSQLAANPSKILITMTDPVVCDEVDTVERITGTVKLKRNGTGAHYLNHKAVWRILSSVLGQPAEEVNCITAHIGGGSSVAVHEHGQVTAVSNAFSGIPSANRAGRLELPPLLAALDRDEITSKELKSLVFSTGGLLSLAGTNDFRALINFIQQGATEDQQKKIQLILDFFGRQIAANMLQLALSERRIVAAVLTGGLARSEDIASRVRNHLNYFPLIRIPGSFEHEALAAGTLQGLCTPQSMKNYVRERDLLSDRRRAENRLLDTTIFSEVIRYRKHGTPITTLDELLASTCIKVKETFMPTVAIFGADNEEAILAAKKANEQGQYKLANFRLVGDFAAISKIAYDYDLVIDDANYIIDDTDNALVRGVELIQEGKAHIVMKGAYKTEEILRAVFKYLKGSGKLQPGQLISHCVVMDIPRRNKLLIISDAAVNTYPDQAKKVQILENALKVAANLRIPKPRVAVISAIESVNKSIESSVDAADLAALFKDRTDCIVEGPLSFDVAMDPAIAHEKKYKGQVAGNADILIMPDIDAGNVLYKTLTTQSGAVCAGVILLGDMPMILTSRGDSARSKLASMALSINMYLDLVSKGVLEGPPPTV
ncbi:MAG: butyrate kinase [Deltaproteobacteria bacterium HGW-Deltaproteobacteria-22]|jgi:phosphate butyryltransferase|nr:MAG: butyrate kinase [Deltaproteobacteria bacterium HGW-Deltaproteobacteria-22]